MKLSKEQNCLKCILNENNTLTFISTHYKQNASKKCHTLARVCNHMNLNSYTLKISMWIRFSTQYCLFVMTEKGQKCLDKGGVSWAILTDLSKAFDCILHDLLIVKLAAYGFNYQSLRIIEIFLFNRQQRTKSNNAFSRYSEIIDGVPQGSIL